MANIDIASPGTDAAALKTALRSAASVGGNSNAPILEQIIAARVAGYSASFTGGSKIDALCTKGDLRGMLLDIYAASDVGSGNPIVGVNAAVTVPTGKVAFLMYHAKSDNCFSDGGSYKHWLRNVTTSTDHNYLLNTAHRNGFVVTDGADSTVQFPIKVGVAGDVLKVQACSGADGHTRVVTGFCIVAFADATTYAMSLD